MTDLLRLTIDVWRYLWPFRTVEQWQMGVYYLWGRYWRTVGPGIWPVLPYFTQLLAANVVPTIHSTPLQTLTLKDGRTLTFSATMTVRVENIALALNSVDQFNETTIELVSGILAEHLARVEPTRLDPEVNNRGQLLKELKAEADQETQKFGVRIDAIRFPSFAFVRTLRLLSERATLNNEHAK